MENQNPSAEISALSWKRRYQGRGNEEESENRRSRLKRKDWKSELPRWKRSTRRIIDFAEYIVQAQIKGGNDWYL
jgi:hypothetical protein